MPSPCCTHTGTAPCTAPSPVPALPAVPSPGSTSRCASQMLPPAPASLISLSEGEHRPARRADGAGGFPQRSARHLHIRRAVTGHCPPGGRRSSKAGCEQAGCSQLPLTRAREINASPVQLCGGNCALASSQGSNPGEENILVTQKLGHIPSIV